MKMKNRLWEWQGLARDTEVGGEGALGRVGSGASRGGQQTEKRGTTKPGMETGARPPGQVWAFSGHLVVWVKPGGQGRKAGLMAGNKDLVHLQTREAASEEPQGVARS